MKLTADYRVMAEKCFKWARNTCVDDVRETYLQLAQFWLEEASKLDPPVTQGDLLMWELLLMWE